MAGSIMTSPAVAGHDKEAPGHDGRGLLALWGRRSRTGPCGRCPAALPLRQPPPPQTTSALAHQIPAPVSSRTLPDTLASSSQPFHTAYCTHVELNRLLSTCTLVPWPGSGQRIEYPPPAMRFPVTMTWWTSVVSAEMTLEPCGSLLVRVLWVNVPHALPASWRTSVWAPVAWNGSWTYESRTTGQGLELSM